jgi:uncharacterized membrane protein HdeD (DUF308 family)
MTVTTYPSDQIREDIRDTTAHWWLFLVLGIAWIWLGFFILDFNWDSVVTISWLVGFLFLASAVMEVFAIFTMSGWKWLHGILAALFAIGAAWAFVYPGQTFRTLAILIGWFLLIKGTFDVVVALTNRDVELWWLTLIVGIIEILIAFWAVGYPGRSAWLLVVWVGIGALVRGVTEIILAFQIRHLHKVAEVAS